MYRVHLVYDHLLDTVASRASIERVGASNNPTGGSGGAGKGTAGNSTKRCARIERVFTEHLLHEAFAAVFLP